MDSQTVNRLLEFVIVAGIVLIIGGLTYWGIASSRRRKQELAEMAGMIGFHPVPKTVYPELKARLARINPRHGSSSKSLQDVFVKSVPEGDLYLYDLWDNSGESSSVTQNRALALVIPGKQFPRFVISARLKATGMLAQLADKLIAWAFGHDLKIVDFQDEPDLNEHFLVAGDDESKVHDMFNSSIFQRLKGLDGLFLAGGGDTLEYSPQFEKYSGKKDVNYLSHKINTALDVMRLFI